MRAKDVMVRDLVAVGPQTSLGAIAQLFAFHQVSAVPVILSDGKPLGIVTKTDLTTPDRERSCQAGDASYYRLFNGDVTTMGTLISAAPGGVAADVMSSALVTVAPDTPLDQAARCMLSAEVHHAIVLDHGRAVGMLTSLDFVRAVAG